MSPERAEWQEKHIVHHDDSAHEWRSGHCSPAFVSGPNVKACHDSGRGPTH